MDITQEATVPEARQAEGTHPLSQLERAYLIFVSPVDVFVDILRSSSWWLPFCLIIACSYSFSFVAVDRIGVETLATSAISAQIASAPPEQRSQVIAIAITAFKISMIAAPALVLVFNLAAAGVFLASFNVVFGAKVTFARALAVMLYSDLINSLRPVAGMIIVLISGNRGGFDFGNPVPVNFAYFLSSTGMPALKSLLFSLDAITIWYLAVVTIGFAIVAKLTRAQAGAVVFGWWAIIVFGRIAVSAIRGH